MSYRDNFKEVEREAVWTLPRIFLIVVLGLVLLYIVGFFATGGDYAIYRFWEPKMENARRAVFENTQSYVQGKQEYLSRLVGANHGARNPSFASWR